jgi:hypothetical protein
VRSTRGERYRSRLRSEERGYTIGVARRVRDTLDRYVLARHGELDNLLSKTQIVWSRVFLAVAISLVIIFGVMRLIVR